MASSVRVRVGTACIFLSRPHADTLVTVIHDAGGGGAEGGGGEGGGEGEGDVWAGLEGVRRRLRVGYSLQRQHDCSLLLHRVLDSLVDAICEQPPRAAAARGSRAWPPRGRHAWPKGLTPAAGRAAPAAGHVTAM